MPETTLPLGVSTASENIFLEMAQRAFSRVSDYRWSEVPEESRIMIAPETSKVDLERLPQIRVSTGNLTDTEGAFDHMLTWQINRSRHLFVDQAYVQFSCYAATPVESRNLADYLRRVIFMAREDLGCRGIFGIRQMQSNKQIPQERAAHDDSIHMAAVSAAYFTKAKVTRTNVEGPLWEFLGLTAHPIDVQLKKVVDDLVFPEPLLVCYEDERQLSVRFTMQVKPHFPAGFTLRKGGLGGLVVPGLAVRHTYHYDRLAFHPDAPVSLRDDLVLSYAPTGDEAFDLLGTNNLPVGAFNISVIGCKP